MPFTAATCHAYYVRKRRQNSDHVAPEVVHGHPSNDDQQLYEDPTTKNVNKLTVLPSDLLFEELRNIARFGVLVEHD